MPLNNIHLTITLPKGASKIKFIGSIDGKTDRLPLNFRDFDDLFKVTITSLLFYSSI
jgi:hypothetical protein